MKQQSIEQLEDMARSIRNDILTSIYIAKSGHPGGSLSPVDILVSLYFHKFKFDPENPQDPDRDRFLLGKGHATPAVSAVQAYRGFFDIKELLTFRTRECNLGVPGYPGCEMSSGSLGQNLSVACGIALSAKKEKKNYNTYILMGDGETQEGQVWEAAMFAAHWKLGKLVALIDDNHVQMCGDTGCVMNVEDLGDKFNAFGWNVIRVDGHDIRALNGTLDQIEDDIDGKPTAIIGQTIKGKGVSFMENTSAWHGGSITDEQYARIQEELGGGRL